jgi:fibronectin-binding autotransporter adhesin
MAIGRISGPLLKENLLRDGVNLRFESNLIYLDVNTHADDVSTNPADPSLWTGRVGIRNSNPAYPLDVTGTARATTILGGELDIDEIYINDNSVSSQLGDLVLSAATSLDKVTINSNVLVNGNLHATGSITADGSLQLGNDDTDNVVFAADIDSNFMPNITDTYIIGGTGKRWLNGNFKFLEIGDIDFSDNTIASSITNGDLNLNGNGTGSVIINNALTVSSSGSITMPGNFSVGGNLIVTGDIIGGLLRTDDIQIVGNRIETTASNSNLELNTVGTGSIELLANSNVTGTFDVSGQSTLASVNVEDLTSGRVVFAGTSGELEDSANLTFNGTTLTVTGDQTVTGTATLGNLVVNGTSLLTGIVTASEDLTVGGTLYVTGDIVGGPLRTDDIQIVGNRIETTASNSNLELNTVGTGSIELQTNTNVTGTFGVTSLATLAQAQVSDLTSGRVTFAGTSGRLQDSSALTFSNGTLTVGTGVVVSGLAGDITITDGSITGVNNISTVSLTASGNATVTGTLTVTGDIVGGPLRTDDIQIVGNRIETTASNSNLELNTVGTGSIELQTNTNVIGTLDVSGQSTLASVNVEDLTSGRIVLAGTSGELEDSANLTFDGTTLTVVDTISSTTGNFTTVNTTTITTTGTATTNNLVVNGVSTLTGPITASDNLTVGGTLYVTGDIVGGPLRTDDIQIVGNRIETTATNSNFEINTVGTGSIELLANTNVTGNLGISGNIDVTGDITLGGNIRIGDTTLDTINVVADFTSDLTPDVGNTFDLGTDTKPWRVVHAAEFNNGVIRIDDNTITTTVSNADLDLRANGTGNIVLANHVTVEGVTSTGATGTGQFVFDTNPTISGAILTNHVTVEGVTSTGATGTENIVFSASPTITGTLTVAGDQTVTGTTTTNNLTINNNATINGTLYVTGDIVGGPLRTDDIQIVGNRIETTASNSNFEINTVGTGTIELLANSTVTGTFDVSGNTTLGTTDGNTIDVKAEFISSLVPDITDTYDLGIAGKRWNQLNTNNALIGDVSVSGTTIETTVLNSDLYLNANGTGSVIISNLLTLGGGGSLAFTGETVNFNNILIDGDGDYSVIRTIDSNTNLYLDAAGTGTINLTSNTNIVGNLDVTGDITLGGNIRIGDTTLDTITVQADFTSDLIPNASNLYDLGASDKQWRIVNAAEFDNNVININDNVITTKVSNADLELRANGTGTILVPQNDVTFSQALAVNGNTTLDVTTINDTLTVNATSTFNGNVGVTGNLIVTGNTTQQGNLTVTQNLTVTGDIIGGPLRTDDIHIVGNRIETTASNSNLEFNTVGTGSIELLANSNVTGTFDVSGQSTLASVNVEDLTSGRVVLAGTLGELEDSANLTFSGTTLTVTGNQQVTGTVNVDTSITTPVGNITTLNAGQANIDGVRIDTTVISTTSSNADLVLDPSGNGIVYINGTGAVRIPAGNTAERPATGESGFIRYNYQTNNIEAWNGVIFAGISGGGSSSDANGDTRLTFETSGNNEDIIRFFTGVEGETLGSTVDSVEQVQISGTGLTVIRNLTVGNDFTVTGNATISEITTDDVRISGNRISTTQSNSNLEITSNGTGIVSVQDTMNVTQDLSVAGTSTLARANVSDLIDGRITYAGASGRLKDSANLVFDGTTLALTGNQTISGTLTVGGVNVSGAGSFDSVAVTDLLINGRIHIYDNIIENTLTNDDLIIRANGTGRVIIDGAGTSEGSGNIYATDPLITLNSAKTTSNTYDSGIIIERGTDINVGLIWDESEDQFALIRTIEQGTVKGNVAITGYQDLTVGSIKLSTETANKVTFTDASKYVRSLDTGTTAYVDGVIKFNTGAQAAIPTGSTAQRPASPQEGTIRYNTTVQQFEGYADNSWQAMGFGAGTSPSYQGFSANGTQFEFTLNQVPLSSAGIIVAINGVVQEPEIAYTVDNAILRFIDDTSTVVAPDVGDRIDVRFLSKPAVSTVRTSNFTGDDTTRAFDTGYTIGSVETVLVFVNSIYQDTDVYSVSGRSVVFHEAPYQDDRVNIVNITTIVAPDLPTKTYVDQQITQVSNTATDDAIAFAIALG